ncbi:MAG: hypothetical protein H6673_02025 [Anaerolineales bacterium]|nr:hypothetical protein [Anaerolineales bacterium]
MKRLILILMTCLLVPIVFTAFAQDGFQSVEFDGNYGISVPDDWEVSEEDGIFYIGSDEAYLLIAPPLLLEDSFEFDADSDIAERMQQVYVQLFEVEVPDDEVVLEKLGRRDVALVWFTTEDDEEGLSLLIEMSDGAFGFLEIYVPTGTYDDYEDLIWDIAFTFDVLRDTVDAGSGEPCQISTIEEGAIPLRVGPGENRSSILFLPADEEFEVLGQAEANDDSLWYKLDVDVIAPESGARELWVAADDVDTVGDCASVGDAVAPPVIPVAPGQTVGGGAGAPEAGEVVPQEGAWTAVLGDSNICNDSQFQFGGQVVPFTVTLSGASILVDGTQLNRTQPQVYAGADTLSLEDGDYPASLLLRVDSPTNMTMSVTINHSGCSFSFLMTMTKS